MHINEAIAKIVGDEPDSAECICDLPICKCKGEIKCIKCKHYRVVNTYPDYLHDANDALRAWEWLVFQEYCYCRITPEKPNSYKAEYDGYVGSFKSFCKAVCFKVIEYSRQANPDLLDYDAIKWE